jgi:hypothetical protein
MEHPAPAGIPTEGVPEQDRPHARSKLQEPPDEEPPLHVSSGQPQGALEGFAGFAVAAETAKQLGPGGMEIAVLVEIESVDELEGSFRCARLGDRHGAIKSNDWRAGEAFQTFVEHG